MGEITVKLSENDIERILIYLEKGAGEVDDILMEIYDQTTREKGE